jgi:uncharacterized protein
LESRFLDAATTVTPDYEVSTPTLEDRRRAAELVTAPLGYVDATVIATAERLKVSNIATVDFKFLGMASQVSLIKPLHFVLQET